MARKQFVLVAGIDYVNFKIDFGALCKLRVEELIFEHKGTAELKFIIYNFSKGSVTTISVPEFGPGLTEIVDQRFNEITILDYIGYLNSRAKLGGTNYLKKTIKGVMSITDIYTEIIQIGSNNPGELIEWNLFYLKYNSFVNSYSDNAVHGSKKAFKKLPLGSRDPDDLDWDPYDDFDPPRMSAKDLNKMRNAFAPNKGYVWIWAEDLFIESDIYAAILILNTKEIYDDTLPDETFVKLTVDLSLAASTFGMLVLFGFPNAEAKKLINKKHRLIVSDVEIPLGLLREHICNLINNTAYQLSKELAVPVLALNGISKINFDSGNNRLPEAVIGSEIVYSFYKKRFGFKDSQRKGFFEHMPTTKPCRSPKLDDAIFKNKKYASDFAKPIPKPTPPRVLPPLPKPTHPSFRLNEYKRHYVFVVGVDYLQQGINFEKKAINRINYLMAAADNRDTTLFQIFNFETGKVVFCEVVYSNGSLSQSGFEISSVNRHAAVRFTVDDTIQFTPVKNDDSMYEDITDQIGNSLRFLKQPEPRCMGMDFVYGRIMVIGENAPDCLREFSFFTHGDESGPKTVHQQKRSFVTDNTTDSNAILPNEKYYRCLDPDPYKDFSGSLFDEENEKNFIKAFHSDAYSWCWSYSADVDLRKLMKAILESKEYKTHGLTDETILTLRNPTPRLRLFTQRVAGLLSLREIPPLKVKMPFGKLLHFFGAVLKSTYMYHLAKLIERPVYAALPAAETSSELENNQSLFIVDPLTKKYTAFFTTHFGFEADPEKRGYGKYVHDFPWDERFLPGVKIEEQIMEEVKDFPVEK